MKSDDKDIAIGCVSVLLMVVMIIPFWLWQGYVLHKCWAWLVLPTFEGLPEITVAQAMGLAVIIGLFKSTKTETREDNRPTKDPTILAFEGIGIAFLGPLFSLGVAWFLRMFLN